MAARVTPNQQQALWAVYRAGTLTTLNQWEYVANDGRVRGQTINGLWTRRLVEARHLPPLRVTADQRIYSSVMQWEATLTRAGQEWIAEQFMKDQGLPTQRRRPKV
jgi:hypothetical protein